MFARAGEPVRSTTEVIQTTKSELLAAWRELLERDQGYLAEIERVSPEGAQRIREEYLAERRRIEALPDGPIQLSIPSVEVGTHSQYTSNATWDSDSAVDPINIVFYRKGAAWDVQYDMKNWAIDGRKWEGASGSSQRAYIYDAMHTGGWDGWRWDQYQLKPLGDSEWPSARYHIRLFQSFVQDSHGQFGWWTVGDAHHDNYGHTCSDDWEGAEQRAEDAFRNADGTPRWFVGAIWEGSYNNAGTWQCAYNNGNATYIELTS